jgi:hypothetical protein
MRMNNFWTIFTFAVSWWSNVRCVCLRTNIEVIQPPLKFYEYKA